MIPEIVFNPWRTTCWLTGLCFRFHWVKRLAESSNNIYKVTKILNSSPGLLARRVRFGKLLVSVDMAENGVELELKDVAVTRSEKLSSPSTQRPNYESLKEHNDNNGER